MEDPNHTLPGARARVGRRDVLKFGAAAAAVASSAGLGLRNLLDAAPAHAATGGPELDDEVLVGGIFMVDIPGCPVASANAQSVNVDPVTVDAVDITSPADTDYRRYAAGDALYGRTTFKFRVIRDAPASELRAWLQECSRGQNVRKNISVILFKKDLQEVRRWNLVDCFPVRWDPGDYSPSSSVAMETLTVKIGHIELP